MTHRLSRSHGFYSVLVFSLFVLAAPPLSAQERDPIPLSQLQVVTQSVGWAEVTVEYRRPVARGRALFGALVPHDRVWTPSADSAAVLTVSEDVWLAGRPVPAGSYALWMVPRAGSEPWTVILSRAARVFHAPYPEGQDLLRVEVAPRAIGHVETLQLAFPRVEGPEAILELQWGETGLPIPLRITPPDGGG